MHANLLWEIAITNFWNFKMA